MYKLDYLYYSKGMTSLNEGKGCQHHNDIRQNKLEVCQEKGNLVIDQ